MRIMAGKSNQQGDAKRKLTSLLHEPLKLCVNEMEDFCLESNDPRSYTQWPSDQFLDRLSGAIRCSASFYARGGPTIWSCVEAIENRRKSLKLSKTIEALVRRAAKLYSPEPRAIQIHKQALEGSEASKKCFKALQECVEGKSQFTSIKWEKHGDILNPSPARGETCEGRAAQICIEWLRWTLKVERPAAPLVFWLMQIGNPDVLNTLGYSGSINVFDRIRSKREAKTERKGNRIRQRKRRLRKKRSALSQDLRNERRRLHKLVRQELKIIDSSDSSEDRRNA